MAETGRGSEREEFSCRLHGEVRAGRSPGRRIAPPPAAGTPLLQEGLPLQTGVPAPIIIITLQGEPGAEPGKASLPGIHLARIITRSPNTEST